MNKIKIAIIAAIIIGAVIAAFIGFTQISACIRDAEGNWKNCSPPRITITIEGQGSTVSKNETSVPDGFIPPYQPGFAKCPGSVSVSTSISGGAAGNIIEATGSCPAALGSATANAADPGDGTTAVGGAGVTFEGDGDKPRCKVDFSRTGNSKWTATCQFGR